MNFNDTLLDNSPKFSMVSYIHKILASGKYDRIMIATGYWDLPGTKLLYDDLNAFLEAGGRLDLMIGQEPELRAYQTRPVSADEPVFPDFYIQRDVALLNDDFMPVAQLLLKYCTIEDEENSQVRIRVYGQNMEPKQFLHAKCYIFMGHDNEDNGVAYGIIGSSNFTEKGLLENAELNFLETDSKKVTAAMSEYSPTKSHLTWFQEKWDLSVPWNGKFIKDILKPAPVGKKAVKATAKVSEPLTPYELYIKLLQMKFGSLVERDATEALEEYLPEKYSRLDYQISAVKQCFSIMRTHGGFMLGDVVGLGKTVVGAMIIRYFLDFPDDAHEKRVLIVTPPAIKSAWKQTIEDFDEGRADRIMDYVDFVTTGSIGGILEEAAGVDIDDVDTDDTDSGEFVDELKSVNYGLILIDESHKFRNSQTLMYQSLDGLISQIGANTGAYPYIGLLSATPQNNTPDDLKNQIYLFERNHDHCSLEKVEGGNLEGFFSTISKLYREARHDADHIISNPEDYPDPKYAMNNVNKRIKAISEKVRDHVLCDILVRRTRTDIKKYYADDIAKQNITFPKICGPVGLKYEMDDELARLFVDTMDVIAPKPNLLFSESDALCYFRYRPIEYFADPTVVKMYQGGNINAERYSRQLAKIMQINLVKRLESSFAAFKSSLRNLRQYTQNMIDMWEHDAIFICPDLDVNAELDVRKNRKKDPKAPLLTFDQCAGDLRKKIAKLDAEGRNEKGRNAEYHRVDFKPEYIDLVRRDLDLIRDLCDRWDDYNEDPKLDKFKDSVKERLLDPKINPSGKLVIFSEAKDTVDALRRTLDNKGFKGQVLVIDASNRDKLEKVIQANFDANYKGDQKDDYKIIITTEVLAEGINLHRANVILNYDTPWNSTKLMQRIGRVNRIGTKADKVHVFNFFPSAQGNSMIQLVQKAYIKLQSFHVLFGEDSKVFSDEEEVKNYDLDTAVNGEESPFEKYVFELRQFKDENPERYKFIRETKDGLEMAAGTDGPKYFLVKTDSVSGLFVKVFETGEARVIPGIEMYKEFACDKDVAAVVLPEDWDVVKDAAIKAFGQYLSKMNIAASKNAPATKAKGIIDRLCNNDELSQKSRNLLIAADKLIRKGNTDVIRKVIAIGATLEDGGALFALTQEEVDAVIIGAIEKLVEEQKKLTGKPYVFIGLAK